MPARAKSLLTLIMLIGKPIFIQTENWLSLHSIEEHVPLFTDQVLVSGIICSSGEEGSEQRLKVTLW
jgi:hypothetical protein